MPSLTRVEKLAGRAFLEVQQAALVASHDTDPPTYKVLPWHKIYRHPCPARGGVSTALELHEQYVLSPLYWVAPVDETVTEWQEPESLPVFGDTVAAGRFGFIYKEGRCRGCKATARSKTGRLVDAIDRPPLEGRIAR